MLKKFTFLISIILIAAMMAPSVIKITHALYEHEELVCENNDDDSDHVHKTELDCEFQKFNLSPKQYINSSNLEKIDISFTTKNNWNHYSFLSKYQKLHFDLRGPPTA